MTKIRQALELLAVAVIIVTVYYSLVWALTEFRILSPSQALAVVGATIIGVLLTYDQYMVESES